VTANGPREPALILKSNGAWLDLGNKNFPLSGDGPEERLTAGDSTLRPRDDDPKQGWFTATFDGERLEGQYTAVQCDALSAGCASAGAGLLPWLSLAALGAARSRRRGLAPAPRLTTSSH
jgi:hypothetical protein